MSSRDVDPTRLDVAAFARAGATLAGASPVRSFPRLVEATAIDALPDDAEVRWSAHGELRTAPGGAPETGLRLTASTTLPLECQRCLTPVEAPLAVDRRFLFVAGEDAAAALDAERDEDVLALSAAFDLPALIEDELLLALPLVPRHAVCPVALPLGAVDPDADAEVPPNPFAVLAALKRDRPLN